MHVCTNTTVAGPCLLSKHCYAEQEVCLQGPVSVASSQKVGKVIDLSWAPLPQPVGGGAVVALALEDGSLAFADTSQAVEHSSRRQRMQAFKHLLGGSWPYPQVPNPSPHPLSLSCYPSNTPLPALPHPHPSLPLPDHGALSPCCQTFSSVLSVQAPVLKNYVPPFLTPLSRCSCLPRCSIP